MTAATLPGSATAGLTRDDRCDRCGAQAFVRATIRSTGSLDLLFCGHHFRAHELTLIATGAVIHDERHRIDEQASVPEV